MTVRRACATITPRIMLPSSGIPMATGSRPSAINRSRGDLPDGQFFDLGVQPLLQKKFCFAADPNQIYNPRRSVPEEGRWPSSRTLGRDAVDAAASGTRVIAGRVLLGSVSDRTAC